MHPLLFVLLQVSAFPFPGHPLMIDQGQVRINLHGLEPSVDWALSVRTTLPKPTIALGQFHTVLPGPVTTAEAWDEKHIHVHNGAVDIDGLASIAKDGNLMILVNVPADTMVVIHGDGPDPIYAGKVHDLLMLRRGTPLHEPMRGEKFTIVKPAPP